MYDDDRGWVAVVDESGNHKQLTEEYASVQGLAWSGKGKEMWFEGTIQTTRRSVYRVTTRGKIREILTAPRGLRVLDISGDGRVPMTRARGFEPTRWIWKEASRWLWDQRTFKDT